MQKGFIFRRVPSVDLLPVDREKEKKTEDKLEGVYKKVTQYFRKAEERSVA